MPQQALYMTNGAKALKEQGNTLFRQQKYTEAAELYTKAIANLSSVVPIGNVSALHFRTHAYTYTRTLYIKSVAAIYSQNSAFLCTVLPGLVHLFIVSSCALHVVWGTCIVSPYALHVVWGAIITGAVAVEHAVVLKACRLNTARCHLETNQFSAAEELCTAVLVDNPRDLKALFRRGLARENLKKISDSVRDLTLALEDPRADGAVKDALVQIHTF